MCAIMLAVWAGGIWNLLEQDFAQCSPILTRHGSPRTWYPFRMFCSVFHSAHHMGEDGLWDEVNSSFKLLKLPATWRIKVVGALLYWTCKMKMTLCHQLCPHQALGRHFTKYTRVWDHLQLHLKPKS